MILKTKEKEKAIKLRKRGFSYSEILKEIPVAKSTLSLWLRSVGLSKRQKQRLTEKKLNAMKRGWEACHQNRLNITKLIKDKARKEIGRVNKRDLWMIGTALYWAEGAKEKQWNTGVGIKFSNSDPIMIYFFSKWLKEICLVPSQDITYDLYIHKKTGHWESARCYWGKILSIPPKKIRVYFKRHKINTKRRNVGKDYHGLLRVNVKRSSNLNRRISGWIEAFNKYCRVV